MNEERRKSDRRVPPAVVEFAVEERQQLLARIQELEAWKAEELSVMNPLMDYARSVCTGPLGCSLTEWLVSDHQRLAALKSQPSGVVLPERWSVPRPIWKDARQPYGDPLNKSDIEAAGKFNLALDEVARLNSPPVSAALSALSHGEQVRDVASVQITGHLDEVDAPVWEFINDEARKLGPITGSIDSYGLSRPNGGQPNGGVVVLWNGQKIHAVALAVRGAMNRTQCIRLLAAAPSAGSQGGDV